MYEEYITAQSTPAGKVLEHILRRANVSQKELALRSGIYPQRIHDLIKGIRRFTIPYSLNIEKALNIGIEGYFYKIQANYEIYQFITHEELKQHPDLSQFSNALFWDTKVDKINWIRNKKWVIKRVFEYGNEQEIKEIIRFYGKDVIKKIFPQIKNAWKKEDRDANYKKYMPSVRA